MSVFQVKKTPPLARPWYCKFLYEGKPYRGGGFETRQEAEQWEKERRNQLGQKKSPEDKFYQEINDMLKAVLKKSETTTTGGIPLGNLIVEFLEYKKSRVSKAQLRKKRTRLMRFKKWFDVMIPDGLEPGMIDKHMEKRLKAVSADDANRDRAILGEVIRWAMPRYKIPYNPVDATESFTHERKVSSIPSEEDVKKALEAIPKVNPAYWKAFGIVIEQTCCRPISAARLCWKDVHFEHPNPRWHHGAIEVKDYKGGKGKARGNPFPMSRKLANTLKAMRDGQHPHELVFPSPYTGKELENWKKVLKKACKEAGVEYFSFGQLRPHGATVLASLGVPIETIQHILGHSKVTTTQIYIRRHGYEESMAEAIERRERRHLKVVKSKVA